MWDKIYLIADPHFGHANIIKYENRPFSSVEEMDTTIIRNWNETVKDNNNEVYVLGDFALSSADRICEIVASLKGRKYLILGNHDNRSRGFWLKAGFANVLKAPFLLGKYMLSHYPIENPPLCNIHGHIHSQPFATPKTHICVSVEKTNYAPVRLGDFLVIE